MTFRLTAPAPAEIADLLAASRSSPFSYAPVGAPATPEGWFDNRGSVELGRGREVFQKGAQALQTWVMFDLGWVFATPEKGDAIRPGAVVGIPSRTLGLWTVNVAKIVSVWDEPRRFAFSYGTTATHVELGEETFSVTWHPDDRVTYDVWSYSRPAHPLVRLFAPIARSFQRRFVRESCARMRRACE